MPMDTLRRQWGANVESSGREIWWWRVLKLMVSRVRWRVTLYLHASFWLTNKLSRGRSRAWLGTGVRAVLCSFGEESRPLCNLFVRYFAMLLRHFHSFSLFLSFFLFLSGPAATSNPSSPRNLSKLIFNRSNRYMERFHIPLKKRMSSNNLLCHWKSVTSNTFLRL